MEHPIAEAALKSGFIVARPSTAHPYALWREKLDALPLGQHMTLEHRPEAVCGWPSRETTIWAALYPAPPFEGWPEGCGEVSGYYMRSNEAREKTGEWENAVRGMGYETLARTPLPARAAAIRAGLGVHGLNGLLITPHGSFVYIALLLVRAAPPRGAPGPEADLSPGCERCGLCRAACPAGAISENGVDALKCLRNDMSHPELMPESHYHLMGKRILGCDECQLACPRNRDVRRISPESRQTGPFCLKSLLEAPDMGAIAELIGGNYARKGRLQTQAALAAANTGRTELIPALEKHLDSNFEPLKKAADWAIKTLGHNIIKGRASMMNETIGAIMSRRSCRAFKPDPVNPDELKAVIDCGLWAPSAMNRQDWFFLVVRESGLIERVSREIIKRLPAPAFERYKGRHGGNENFSMFYGAPAVIFVFGDAASGSGPVDGALATENICLAAESLGLGSCIIGLAALLLEAPEADVLSELRAPEGYVLLHAIALGYRAAEFPAPERLPGRVEYID